MSSAYKIGLNPLIGCFLRRLFMVVTHRSGYIIPPVVPCATLYLKCMSCEAQFIHLFLNMWHIQARRARSTRNTNEYLMERCPLKNECFVLNYIFIKK